MTSRIRRTAGFTLVEVVIAISLVSVIMLGLITAFVTFGNTGASLDRRAMASDDVRLVYGFLRESLASASSRLYLREHDGANVPAFAGGDVSLAWLGLMPARHGVGGLYHMRIDLERDDRASRLVLRYRPFRADEPEPDWSDAAEHLLLDEVSELSIAYRRVGSEQWHAEWYDEQVLPGHVRIGLSLAESQWPALVVRVLAGERGVVLDDGEPRPDRTVLR